MSDSNGKMVFPKYTKTMHHKGYPAIDPTNPKNSAAGKVVLVTGGNAGIGKGIAKAFVQAGAKAIAILGRNEKTLQEAKAELEKAGSSKILALTADVLDPAALDKAFETTAKEVGNIDVCVANAGWLSDTNIAAHADVADWWKGFEINVKGTLLTFQSWMKHKSTNSPIFISTNTAAAHAGMFPAFSSYGSSKAAALQLVAYFQVENPDIKAVSIHPGAIQTDMFTKAALPIDADEMSLPTGFVVWLAGAQAPEWVKGRFLWAHWDVEELEAMKEEIVERNELTLGLLGWPKM